MNKWINLISTAVILAGSTCAGATIIQETDSGKFKAQLKNVQLADIMHYVEDRYGVTFKGDASALQTPITVNFDNLDMESMLKRVLARKNFFFVYNKHGEVIEVRLLPGGSNTGKAEDFVFRPLDKPLQDNGGEFPAGIFRANGTTAEGVYPNAYAFNASGATEEKAQEPDEITKFQVDPKAQDEITKFKVDPKAADDDIARFNVDQKASPEKDPSFKVVPNAVPPEDTKKSDVSNKKL